MPTELVPQKIVPGGVVPTFVAAAIGDTVRCGPGVVVVAKKAGAGARVVEVVATSRCDQGVLHNPVATVPGSGEAKFGPILAEKNGNAAGIASVIYDDVASTTVAALEFPA